MLKKTFDRNNSMFPDVANGYPIACCIDGEIETYTVDGIYDIHRYCIGYDLLLDDSVAWEKPLVKGDIVEVFNQIDEKHEDWIFVDKCKDGVVVVCEEYADKFKNGDVYSTEFYYNGSWRRKTENEEPQETINIESEITKAILGVKEAVLGAMDDFNERLKKLESMLLPCDATIRQ